MTHTNPRRPQLNFLIVILAILVSGSLYYASILKNVLLIPLFFLLTLYFVNSRININKHKLLFWSFALLLTASNLRAVPSSLLVLMTCITCALLITELIHFNEFASAYIKIILFLSIASWFYLPTILFHIPSPLPDFISIVDKTYSNFIFFGVLRDELAAMFSGGLYVVARNSGIFWEPGAFQIFVNSAVYLSIVTNQLNRKRYLIFLVTILTASSTAGLIVFGLLSLIYYSRTNEKRTRRQNLALIGLAFVGAGIFSGSQIFSMSLDKFVDGSSSNVSFIARSTDYLVDSSIVRDNFLRGVGYGNISVRENVAIDLMGSDLYETAAKPPGADGLLLFISYVGIFGLVVIWRLIYPSQIRNWLWYEKGALVLAMVMMYNNENMLAYLFPWVMMFYGFSKHANATKLVTKADRPHSLHIGPAKIV